MKKYQVLVVGLFLALGCVEPYQPPTATNSKSILVVDGFFNTNGVSDFALTRALSLTDPDITISIIGARVTVEDKSGNSFLLKETSAGHYTTVQNNLPLNQTYRLLISTPDNQEYASDFVTAKNSPPIDSISWQLTNDKGVQIFVNTHDPQNNTRRYLWKFIETWLYTSAFHSDFYWSAGQVFHRDDDIDIYRCYQTENSSKILFTSTQRLSQDIVTSFPITYIPQNSERISNKYSILVTQSGLTEEAYIYWDQLKKNTENLGTLFAPQPALVTGNINNISNPGNPALGFFSAGTTTEKRIFIPSDNLFTLDFRKYETIYASCEADTLFNKDIATWKLSTTRSIIDIAAKGRTTVGYRTSSNQCVDCRRKNGTNVKPDFWK